MHQAWQPVDLDAKWFDFAPGTALLYTDTDAVVLEARRSGATVSVRIQRLDGERFTRKIPSAVWMREEAYKLLGPGVRAVSLPAVIWHEDGLFAPRNLVGLLTTAVVITLMIGLFPTPALNYWAFVIGGAAGVFVRRQWK
ncbi:MAG: hypothetical protein GX596_04720, partial [Propionibacterium sp.]|nr:hypothetical protein [Propionibacterium sp.]